MENYTLNMIFIGSVLFVIGITFVANKFKNGRKFLCICSVIIAIFSLLFSDFGPFKYVAQDWNYYSTFCNDYIFFLCGLPIIISLTNKAFQDEPLKSNYSRLFIWIGYILFLLFVYLLFIGPIFS